MHVGIAGWLAPLGPSGAQRRLVELIRHVRDHLEPQDRITVIGGPADLVEGVPHVPAAIPPGPTWRRARAEQRVLPQLVRSLAIDVLDLQSLPVASHLPVPVALTIHDLRDLGPYRRRPRPVARFALKRSLARTSIAIVPSQFVANELRQVDHEIATAVVPGGVDEAFFLRRSGTPGTPYILHVGHLEPRKNLTMLVEAFARYRATGGDSRLILAGVDSGSGTELADLVGRQGLGGAVEFAGPVDETDLPQLYANSRATVVPSHYEGFGLPALEAMAAGTPLLVSDRGALPEVVGACAQVLPADDRDAWAAAMAACETPNWLADSARGRARRYSWDAAASGWIAAWRRAADQVEPTNCITP